MSLERISLTRRVAVATLVVTLACRPSTAAPPPGTMTIAGLGTISFPVTTSVPAADSAFVRGVLLLHLFEYADARASFQAAQELDSSMAMAYWGAAMTYNHAVWDEQDAGAARAVLAKLGATPEERQQRAATDRERAWLHTLDVLYGDGPKARRDTLYAYALQEMLQRFPDDDEVRSFYALAVLGLSQGVRDVPSYLRAASIAESVFTRNPQHPGAAHYWIHGMDDPEHATGALPAARALSGIAPDAGHAQHMTSHIFLALGMWDDVVRANVNGMRVVNGRRAARNMPPTSCGHYATWLAYGWQQLGMRDSALVLVEGCMNQSRTGNPDEVDPDNSTLGSAVGMWARFLIDTEEWDGALADWSPDPVRSDPARFTWSFARGLAASRRGDLETARAALTILQAVRGRLGQRFGDTRVPQDAEYLKRLEVMDRELQAVVELARPNGSVDIALALLRRATAAEDSMAYAFGPPAVEKPAHELLGEVLLAHGDAAGAQAAFEATLRRQPGRALALRGLERAKAAAGPGTR